MNEDKKKPPPSDQLPTDGDQADPAVIENDLRDLSSSPTHKGQLLMDANVAPQKNAYPTDLNLLNDARMMSEKLIDELYALIKEREEKIDSWSWKYYKDQIVFLLMI